MVGQEKPQYQLLGRSTNAPWLLCVWGVAFLLQMGCTSVSAERTFKAMSAEITSPLEACPNISGTYEFIGKPLSNQSTPWAWELFFDYFLQHRSMLFRYAVEANETIKAVTVEVELTQDQTIAVHFNGAFGQKTVRLPERPDDRLGCGNDGITLVRTRGINLSEGGGSGYNVFKHTFVKNADGALDVTVQMVGHYRTWFILWTYEELNDARFAPKR